MDFKRRLDEALRRKIILIPGQEDPKEIENLQLQRKTLNKDIYSVSQKKREAYEHHQTILSEYHRRIPKILYPQPEDVG